MAEELIKFFSILLLTMLKFIAGPLGGYAAGFSFINAVLVTVLGMMSSVTLFTYLGAFLRESVFSKFSKKRRTFTKRNRKFVSIWKKYGVVGVAMLTPILLTPIGGTLVLISFRTSKSLIMVFMFVSAVFWAILITGVVYVVGDEVFEYLDYSPS